LRHRRRNQKVEMVLRYGFHDHVLGGQEQLLESVHRVRGNT
jgi:hypothetical protein